jgi:hypothetical protein
MMSDAVVSSSEAMGGGRMGICLYFTSVEPVAEDVENALREEWDQSPSEQPWVLCEPPHFYPTGEDGRLRGGSKLNLHPWADEWEAASQAPAEQNDLQELLRQLCAWSERYGVDWELSVEGEPLGQIEGGVCPPGVEAALEAFADVGQYLAEEFPQEHPGTGDDDPPGPGLRIWRGPE